MQTTKNPLHLRRGRGGRRTSELLVSDGRVGCPRALADADLDRCFSCALLADIRVDEQGRTWVSCRPAAHQVTAAELRVI